MFLCCRRDSVDEYDYMVFLCYRRDSVDEYGVFVLQEGRC